LSENGAAGTESFTSAMHDRLDLDASCRSTGLAPAASRAVALFGTLDLRVPIDKPKLVVSLRPNSHVRDYGNRDKETIVLMKIRPLGDRILVKRIKEEDKTKGGIIIPDTAKEKPQEGKVVAVGKGKMTEAGKLVAPDVKAGDRILFGKYSGSEVKLEGEEHLILREDDILGVLEG
jgi:chaperonin GroES